MSSLLTSSIAVVITVVVVIINGYHGLVSSSLSTHLIIVNIVSAVSVSHLVQMFLAQHCSSAPDHPYCTRQCPCYSHDGTCSIQRKMGELHWWTHWGRQDIHEDRWRLWNRTAHNGQTKCSSTEHNLWSVERGDNKLIYEQIKWYKWPIPYTVTNEKARLCLLLVCVFAILSVCLSATLLKKLVTNFDVIFRRPRQWVNVK